MRYGSVCSGIEAATAAWHPLGWEPAFFSEIDGFPRAVLKYHYPHVPLHGDFTTIRGDEYGPVQLLVGGTPCQSFSVAGLRGGLDDDRGNLALEFLRLADRARPEWLVWENVPGVLSSDGGRDFGSILGGLVELGYGFSYRVLDAQHFGVPQRRRRVFVVGHLGDWRRAAAVLFECHSLQGHHPPSREAGERIADSLTVGANQYSGFPGEPVEDDGLIARCRNAKGGAGRMDGESETFIAHSLRARGFDASEDGTGRGTPLIPISFLSNASFAEHGVDLCGSLRTENQHAIAFDTTQITSAANRSHPKLGDACRPLAAGAHAPAIAFTCKDHGGDAGATAPTLRAGGHSGSHANAGVMPAVALTSAVRRLTPRECERLQGFPDDYTRIPWRGKEAPDGPRYKALGNSMAVPVMRWIGERIQACLQLSN